MTTSSSQDVPYDDCPVLFDEETIRSRVRSLGQRLTEDFGDANPLLVPLLGGSEIFLADLVRAIRKPVRYEFIQVHYVPHHAGGDDEVMRIEYPIPFELKDQHLLVLKDVVTTGVIENYLIQQFRQRGAASVRFAALIDLPDQRRTHFVPDYHVFTTERVGSFVGYGLKYRGKYGNLPFISQISP